MKRYDQKFKEEALKLSDDIRFKKAGEQLNLNYGTLSGWRKQRVKKNKTCKKSGDETYRKFNIKSGVIIHSDSGSQYTSLEYCKIRGTLHAVQSMSGVGKCRDNSRMESWFATLKKEKIYQPDTTKMTVEEVKTIVWRYTFAYYNSRRVTTVNPGGWPPTVYRKRTASGKVAA